MTVTVKKECIRCGQPFDAVKVSDKYCAVCRGSNTARNMKRAAANAQRKCRAWWCSNPVDPRQPACKACLTTPIYVPRRHGGFFKLPGYARFQEYMRKPPQFFAGVDGEGFGRNDGHAYRLLSAGTESLISETDITWDQALTFLYEQYDENAVYVAYYFKYDLARIFRTLREDRAKMMGSKYGIASRKRKNPGNPMPFPVEACPVHAGPCKCPKRWVFDMMEGERRVYFKPKRCTCPAIPTECSHVKALPPMWICDVADYFQAPFLDVIESDFKAGGGICTAEELEQLRQGKDHRASAELSPETITYNRLENILLARAMDRVKNVLARCDIFVRKNEWYGVGHAAQLWMDGQPGILPRDESTLSRELLQLGKASYYAGWMEDIAHGIIPGSTYAYDRNSAYAADMAGLPCLEHGTWTHRRGQKLPALRPGHLRLVHGTFAAPGYAPTGPLPYREANGSTKRPQRVSGWYWEAEVTAARDAGLIERMDIDEWQDYAPCGCPPPFAQIKRLYSLRKQYPKGTIENRILRVLPSTVYGKMCQSAGEPKYANFLYASLITSLCRTKMLEAIAANPRKASDLVRVAQDAVYFRHERPELTESDELGGWRVTAYQNLTLFQPGMYWHDETRAVIQAGGTPDFRARGFKSGEMTETVEQADAVYRDWSRTSPMTNVFPEITFTSRFDICTLSQAIRSDGTGAWSNAGRVREVVHTIRSVPAKHRSVDMGGLYWDIHEEMFRSMPYLVGNSGLESAPYNKKNGWKEEQEEELGTDDNGPVLSQVQAGMRLN
jgi:hypothetical protein